jgi:hypothetical protein
VKKNIGAAFLTQAILQFLDSNMKEASGTMMTITTDTTTMMTVTTDATTMMTITTDAT